MKLPIYYIDAFAGAVFSAIRPGLVRALGREPTEVLKAREYMVVYETCDVLDSPDMGTSMIRNSPF